MDEHMGNRKKYIIIGLVSMMVIVVVIWGMDIVDKNKRTYSLQGTYRSSELIGSYTIELSGDTDREKFDVYVNQHRVDQGTYEQTATKQYVFDGMYYDFVLKLEKGNTFQFQHEAFQNGEPFHMKNVSIIKIDYDTLLGNEEVYENLYRLET